MLFIQTSGRLYCYQNGFITHIFQSQAQASATSLEYMKWAFLLKIMYEKTRKRIDNNRFNNSNTYAVKCMMVRRAKHLLFFPDSNEHKWQTHNKRITRTLHVSLEVRAS